MARKKHKNPNDKGIFWPNTDMKCNMRCNSCGTPIWISESGDLKYYGRKYFSAENDTDGNRIVVGVVCQGGGLCGECYENL